MNYKKFFVGCVLFFCVLFVGWKIIRFSSYSLQSASLKTQKEIQQQSRVSVTINTGSSIATYDGVLALTVFDGLTTISADKKIELSVKHYDFGVFIEKIGDLENTKDKAWIYYVNGASGDVAADKKTVKNGDVVEWRYTKPMY